MAVALVALAVGTGAANAALIKAKWDPEYGPAFPGLAFEGEAEFYVPDSLLEVDPIYTPTFFADACTGGATGAACISLRSAFVDLYTFPGAAGTYPTGREFQQRLQFASPGGAFGSDLLSDPLLGAVLQFDSETGQNEVIGASSSFIGPFEGFFMRLGPGGEDPGNDTELPEGADAPYKASSLFACVSISNSEGCVPGLPSNPATAVFSRVPEPGSLALVLGALAAGWTVRRSRRLIEPASC